jgi:hypothetical protein
MKTILQSVIAAAGVYVLARFVTAALSPRGSSASIAEQMAAQHTTQFLNNLDEIASH